MIKINLQQQGSQKPKKRAATPAEDAGTGSSGPSLPSHVTSAAMLLVAAAGGLGGAFVVHANLLGEIASVQASTRQAEAELLRLRAVLEEIEQYKRDKVSLQQKLAAIRRLEGARRGPVKIYEELGAIMPPQVWVTSLQEQGMSTVLNGIGLDSQSVAVFVNAMQRSPYFANVELGAVEQISYLGLKVKKFQVTCRYQMPSTGDAGASAPGAPGAAAGSASMPAR